MHDDDRAGRRRAVRIRLDGTTARPPGRRRTWTVTAGRWCAEAATEKAAADALAEHLHAFLMQYEPPRVLFFRGYTAVVEVDLGDAHAPVTWCYRVVDPSGHISYIGTGTNWAEAEAAARHDLAQRSTDWHDDDSVHTAAAYLAAGPAVPGSPYGADELYAYAAFQRAARVATATGREDWHEWSIVHRPQFAINRPSHPAG